MNHLDEYDDRDYDLVVFDEYKGQKTITWMNTFVQGGPIKVYRRYNSYNKTKNIPVIVLSNYTIQQCYSKTNMFNPERLLPLIGRFNCINITKFIDFLH